MPTDVFSILDLGNAQTAWLSCLPFTYSSRKKKTSLARIQPKERIIFANRTSDIGEPTAGTAGCLIDKAVIVRPSLSFRTAAIHSAESCKFDGFDFS